MPYFGEPYAFLQNKNDSKWGLVEIPPVWGQRRHFQPADYDLLEKERLAARRFGHVRHDIDRNVLEPSPSSLSYAPESDRLSKDFEVAARLDHATTLCKKKEILDSHKIARNHREKRAEVEREEEWKTAVQKETWMRYDHPHARVLANRTSVAYDPITLRYHDGYEGEQAKYNDDAARQDHYCVHGSRDCMMAGG